MQGLIRCVFLAGLACACGPGDIPVQADAPGPMDSGLIVKWTTSPAIPGDGISGLVVHRARFSLDTLRVVGDAGPGDPRTTASLIDVRWRCAGSGDSDWPCSETEAPADMMFDEAPPGLYSQVALKFDGSAFSSSPPSFRIEGEVDISGTVWDFDLEGSNPLTFNVSVDKMVDAGEQATIHLRINFTHALDSIDWANLDIDDGDRELHDGDSQMSMFRTKLQESFEIVNITTRPVD